MFTKADVVFTYTAQEAIEDGGLIDISDFTKEIGCRSRVVITSGIYEKCMLLDSDIKAEEVEACSLKYNMPRLLNMLKKAIFAMRQESKSRELPYEYIDFCDFVQSKDPDVPIESSLIKIVFGVDFDETPIITILFPHEDYSGSGFTLPLNRHLLLFRRA